MFDFFQRIVEYFEYRKKKVYIRALFDMPETWRRYSGVDGLTIYDIRNYMEEAMFNTTIREISAITKELENNNSIYATIVVNGVNVYRKAGE